MSEDFKITDSIWLLPKDLDTSTSLKRNNIAEPIKHIEDINKIANYLSSNRRYRDNLIFIMGISWGLHCSDLLKLKFNHILDADYNFFVNVQIPGCKQRKPRICRMNSAVLDAAKLYLDNLDMDINLDNYLFTNMSHNRKKNENSSISVYSIERMLKKVINDQLGIDIKAGTNCMKKTYDYHFYCINQCKRRCW